MRISADIPRLLLTMAIRRMPDDRREWGAAMLAELEQLQDPFTRLRFALGCAAVALFPPLKRTQTVMTDTLKSKPNLGSPALISFGLMAPFAILEFIFQPINKQNAPGLIMLFSLLWLLPMLFIVILGPVARTIRAGNSILANPSGLLFRVAFLTLIAIIWVGIVIDQLPCFLGIPNCD